MAEIETEEESGNEVTLFRPSFSQSMFMQKAEEAGFMTAIDPAKWAKLFSLLAGRSIGFYHAEPKARKIIDSAHGRNKDITLRMRGESNGSTARSG